MNFGDDIGGTEISIYRNNPTAWFERYGNIVPKDLTDYDVNQRPTANVMQEKLGEIISWCSRNYKPVDVIISKPRQEGCSTITVASLYVFVRSRPNVRTLILGGEDSQCENLWVILQHYAETDQCNWGNTFTTGDKICKCSNGSIIRRRTAGNPKSGRGGTWHAIIITELAHWPTEGAKNAAKSLTSALGGVPKNIPGVMLITESTAFGPEGRFPNQFNGAVEFEDFKLGKIGNGTIRMFFPWFAFPKVRVKLTEAERAGLREKLQKARDTKALLVWDRYKLDAEQVAHYHNLLSLQEIGGDQVARDREYPSCPEDGFQASNPSRFSREGLEILERQSLDAEANGQVLYGILVMDKGATLPRVVPCSKDNPECNIWMVEGPKHGRAYIIGVDNCTGRQNTTSDDIDKNAAIVVGEGYMQGSVWHPAEPVAMLAPGNEDEADELAKFVYWLSLLYGGCMIAPEKNAGAWLISGLRGFGALMIETPKAIDEQDQSEGTEKYGWLTTRETKKALMNELARRIREPLMVGAGLACKLSPIASELRTIIRHPSGEEGAVKVTGVHDDTTMALGIGIMCISSATVYTSPQIERLDWSDRERRKANVW